MTDHINSADEQPNSDASSEGADAVREQLEAEIAKLKNEALYLRAEFDNYRKQAIKERSDLMKFGSERLLLDVLGVLDNFERAVESADQGNVEMYKKGVELTAAELRSVLTRAGVQEVPSVKVVFDPAVHEALGSEVSEDIPPGHIKSVFKKAYRLHDRVLRPAQVVVAKARE
jgi:molecular chaperone GrpE